MLPGGQLRIDPLQLSTGFAEASAVGQQGIRPRPVPPVAHPVPPQPKPLRRNQTFPPVQVRPPGPSFGVTINATNRYQPVLRRSGTLHSGCQSLLGDLDTGLRSKRTQLGGWQLQGRLKRRGLDQTRLEPGCQQPRDGPCPARLHCNGFTQSGHPTQPVRSEMHTQGLVEIGESSHNQCLQRRQLTLQAATQATLLFALTLQRRNSLAGFTVYGL